MFLFVNTFIFIVVYIYICIHLWSSFGRLQVWHSPLQTLGRAIKFLHCRSYLHPRMGEVCWFGWNNSSMNGMHQPCTTSGFTMHFECNAFQQPKLEHFPSVSICTVWWEDSLVSLWESKTLFSALINSCFNRNDVQCLWAKHWFASSKPCFQSGYCTIVETFI